MYTCTSIAPFLCKHKKQLIQRQEEQRQLQMAKNRQNETQLTSCYNLLSINFGEAFPSLPHFSVQTYKQIVG